MNKKSMIAGTFLAVIVIILIYTIPGALSESSKTEFSTVEIIFNVISILFLASILIYFIKKDSK